MHDEHHIHTIFQSEILHVENFQCPAVVASHDAEEFAYHHEFVFPRAGLFLRYDTFGTVIADVNQILFFHENQPYQISHPAKGGDVSTIVRLSPAVLVEMIRCFDPAVENRPDRPFPTGHTLVETGQRIALHQILATTNDADILEFEERMLVLLASVLHNAYRLVDTLSHSPRPANAKSQDETVNSVKLVLAARFREKLSLDEIASSVYSSPYHLCRIFRQTTGITIHRYLHRIRLLHALEYLAERPASNLNRVALDYGFNSHSHFSNSFVNEFGVTPSEFCHSVSGRQFREMRRILKA